MYQLIFLYGFIVKIVTFKIPEKAKDKLEKYAKEDRRPLSNLVRNIVLDWLDEQEKKAKKKSKK